jgi:hypothetical protein
LEASLNSDFEGRVALAQEPAWISMRDNGLDGQHCFFGNSIATYCGTGEILASPSALPAQGVANTTEGLQ